MYDGSTQSATTRGSIDVEQTVVFTAIAVSHSIEAQTGWSIKKLVRTARRYHTVTAQADSQTLTKLAKCTVLFTPGKRGRSPGVVAACGQFRDKHRVFDLEHCQRRGR